MSAAATYTASVRLLFDCRLLHDGRVEHATDYQSIHICFDTIALAHGTKRLAQMQHNSQLRDRRSESFM